MEQGKYEEQWEMNMWYGPHEQKEKQAVYFIFFLKILFIWQRETQRGREHKEGEREREKQASHRAGSPMRGSIPGPWAHDLSWRQRLNDWVTQAPLFIRILNI